MVTTERVVEYPFVFENLKRVRGHVLDVGCCHSRLPIALASRGYHVVGLDFQSYVFRHPCLQAIRGDLMALPFAPAAFDAVVAVSVIEHIGIGHYGEPEAEMGDRHAVRQLAQVLKRGGRLILTVPFGVALTNHWMRVYDSRRLADLCESVKTEAIEFAVARSGIWRPSSRQEAQTVDWAGPDRAIAMVVATAA
jgi:SAM-dependent methyltransferase